MPDRERSGNGLAGIALVGRRPKAKRTGQVAYHTGVVGLLSIISIGAVQQTAI